MPSLNRWYEKYSKNMRYSTMFECSLSECHMRTLSLFLLLSLCVLQYQHKLGSLPHLARLFSQIPTNGNTQPHLHANTHSEFRLREPHHSKRRWLHHVLQYRGVALPLWSMIRELCCSQIELSEQLPFNPPFHTKKTQTHCRQLSKVTHTHKMEIMTSTEACKGQCESVIT